MKEEELQALHIFNVSRDYITRRLNEQITSLTSKALSLKISEADRVIAIAGKNELENFMMVLKEDHNRLIQKQRKEEEVTNG